MDTFLSIQYLIDTATPWLVGVAGVFVLVALGALFAERRPYREPLAQFRRLGHFWQLFVILSVCFATRHGGAKPDGGDRGGGTQPGVALRVASIANSGGGGGQHRSGAGNVPLSVTDTPAFSNLAFSAIGPSSTNIALIATRDSITNREEAIDVYMRTNLVAGAWGHLAEVAIDTASQGVAFDVPTEWLDDAPVAFFCLGSRLDSDGDGLTDAFESLCALTNPTEPDTDGDGLNDGWELAAGFSPVVNNLLDDDPVNDPEGDSDIDGLDNYHESVLGTSIASSDSDGDGISDGVEVPVASLQAQAAALAAQTMLNPLLLQNPWFNIPLLANCSNPCSGDNADYVAVAFYYGDPSSSASEKYALVIEPVAGTGKGVAPQTLSFVNGLYGVCDFAMAFLKKGWRYHVRLRHSSTDFSKVDDPDPDYALLGAYGSPFVHFSDPGGLFGVTSVTDNFFTGQGKFATIDVYDAEITLCDPDSSDWAEMNESRVVLDDELLKVKISAWPCFSSVEQIKTTLGATFSLETSGTCPGGATVDIPVDAAFATEGCAGQIRFSLDRDALIAAGLVPAQDEDGIDEKSSYDIGNLRGVVPNVTSDTTDSEAFMALPGQFRGKANADTTHDLDSLPPVSRLSTSFFQAAGCEIVRAGYFGQVSARRQVMNQADYFYYSGHGFHATGHLSGDLMPSMVTNYWTRDLDCVILAGCSVLDINDYNNNSSGIGHLASPGKRWCQTGVGTLLGYCGRAPADSNNVSSAIITSWISQRSSLGDIDAWMKANADNRAWNACCIENNVRFVYFERLFFGKINVKKEIPKAKW